MPPKSRSAIGRKAKEDGKAFERLIVKKLKDEGIDSQRNFWQSMQEAAGTGGARVPDIFIDGFWPECGDGKTIRGEKKLLQARADLERFRKSGVACDLRPVAITRREGQRSINVTVSADDLVELLVASGVDPGLMVQIDFSAFVEIIRGIKERDGERQQEDQSVWRTVG